MRYLSEIFWRHSRDVHTLFQIILNLLHVCQSVSWLTSLQILNKCRDISCSKRDIFLKFLRDSFGMFLENIPIILNFLCVCQSVSWLTSLLNLDKYRHISSFGWDILPNCFGDIPWMLVHYIQIILNILYVRQSVGWLISLLELYKYRDISSSGWEIFLKCFGYIPGMLVHYLKKLNFLYVCQSVSWLISLLKL